MKKKLLALALALALCLTLTPAATFAEETPAESAPQNETGELPGGGSAQPSSFEAAEFNAYTVTETVTAVAVSETNVSPSLQTASVSFVNDTVSGINFSSNSSTDINLLPYNQTTPYNQTAPYYQTEPYNQPLPENKTVGNATPSAAGPTGPVYTGEELLNGSIVMDQEIKGPTLYSTTIERIGDDALRIFALLGLNTPNKYGAGEMYLYEGNVSDGNASHKSYDPSSQPNGWLTIDTIDVNNNKSWISQPGGNSGEYRYIYNRTISNSHFFLGYGNITTNASFGIAFTELDAVSIFDHHSNSTYNMTMESEPSNLIVFIVPEEGTGAVTYNRTIINGTGGGVSSEVDLGGASVTGVNSEKEYTESELSGIGLSGLTKGVDYTVSISSSGNKWIVSFEPVSGRTKGSKSIEVKAHVHVFDQVTVTAPATCTTDAVLSRACVCSAVSEDTAPHEGDPAEYFAHHVWGAEYQSDPFYHWTTCTVCGEPSDKLDHSCSITGVLTEANCLDGATVNAVCDICQKTMILSANINSDLAMCPALAGYKALGHDFSGPVTYNSGPKVCTSEGQGNHAPTCTRCKIHDTEHIEPHNWTGLHNVSNGNCGDPDDPVIQEAVCSECDATLHIEKPREHVPVEDKSQDVQATCTESGKINGHRCTICGTFYDYEFVEALGHDWVENERKEATCENDGYIRYTCSRCKEEKTEILECRTKDRQHHWVLNVDQAPTCAHAGTYDGDICSVCGEKTNKFHGVGIIDELGHKVESVTTKIGRVKNKVSLSGTPMEITCYRIDYYCGRCKARLGVEYYTVATAAVSVIGHGSFQIEPGKDAEITDMKNGIHVNGNMANDGGVYFDGCVMDGLSEVVEQGGKKYQYKKVPANSFIIEFSDWFLKELKDGEHTVEIINGNEYWPMIVEVENHKLVGLKPIPEPDLPELSDEQYEAFLKEAAGASVEVKELFLGCPDRG